MPASRFDSVRAILDHTVWIPYCGCMIWMGDINRRGYGIIQRNGKRSPAHRVMKEMEIGRPLSAKELALHKCDMPGCCRPDHVVVGSAQENMGDMWLKGRAKPARGTQKSNFKMTPDQSDEMVGMRLSGKTLREIASRFDVTVSSVSRLTAVKTLALTGRIVKNR